MDKFAEIRVPIAHDNPSIRRRENKCVLCGKCKDVCKKKIGVAGYWEYDSEDIVCINCGQCLQVCPVHSIVEQNDTRAFLDACANKKKCVVAIMSPATRVAFGEEFGIPSGENVAKKLVSALKHLGLKYVFDVTFGADMTVMEEAGELIDRLSKNEKIPMFTSCCPAWVKFVETFYPEYISNLSTCKSPIAMQSSLIKSYFAKKHEIKSTDIYVVAITPCVAKKFEAKREELSSYYGQDTDLVVTVKELAELIKKQKINFKKLDEVEFDSAFPTGSGAGAIFGASGGVMEAVVRTAYYMTTGNNPPKDLLEFKKLRGYNNVKTAKVNLNGKDVRLCVVYGTNTVREMLKKQKLKTFDMLEVMACPNGCVGGGGQPIQKDNDKAVVLRAEGLYKCDKNCATKSSYETKQVKEVYKEFLDSPNSDMAHKLLHTTFRKR